MGQIERWGFSHFRGLYADTQSVAEPKINPDNSFSRSMEGFYVPCAAARVSAPKLILFNHTLAKELGLKAHRF